jgi:hypothetical protein
LLFRTDNLTIPGSVNSPERLISFSARAASSSNQSRTSVRFTSNFSAKNAKSADLVIFWAVAIRLSPQFHAREFWKRASISWRACHDFRQETQWRTC